MAGLWYPPVAPLSHVDRMLSLPPPPAKLLAGDRVTVALLLAMPGATNAKQPTEMPEVVIGVADIALAQKL